MKKFIVFTLFVLLALVGQAESWEEFLKNSDWRMQNPSEFVSLTMQFRGGDSLMFETYKPITQEKLPGIGTYKVNGNVVSIYFGEGTETIAFTLKFINRNKIMLNAGVYGRLCSNEDYMLQKLFQYNNPNIILPAPIQNATPATQTYVAKKLCYVCHGLKRCDTCKGMGETSYYGYTNVCGGCKGTGICWRCNGTGYEK